MKKYLKLSFWQRGNGTMMLSSVIMVVIFYMFLLLYVNYSSMEAMLVLKTRNDAIADGAAVYADTGNYTNQTLDNVTSGNADYENGKTVIDTKRAKYMFDILLKTNNDLLASRGLKISSISNANLSIGTNINGEVYYGQLSSDNRFFITDSEIKFDTIVKDINGTYNSVDVIEILNKENYLDGTSLSDNVNYYPDDYTKPCIPLIKSYITTFDNGSYSSSESENTKSLYNSILSQFRLNSKRYSNAIKDKSASYTEKVLLWDVMTAFGAATSNNGKSINEMSITDIFNFLSKSDEWNMIATKKLTKEIADNGFFTVVIYNGHIYIINPSYEESPLGANYLSTYNTNTKEFDVSKSDNIIIKSGQFIYDTPLTYKKGNCYVFSYSK